MPKPGEKPKKASSTKTDAMRALREQKHREMMAERAEREAEEARAAKAAKKKPAQALPPLDLPPLDVKPEEMPLTFKLWKKAVEELRQGEVDWTLKGLEQDADDAFEGGVLPSVFAANLEASGEATDDDLADVEADEDGQVIDNEDD